MPNFLRKYVIHYYFLGGVSFSEYNHENFLTNQDQRRKKRKRGEEEGKDPPSFFPFFSIKIYDVMCFNSILTLLTELRGVFSKKKRIVKM